MAPETSEQDLLYFNGVNGDTGDYDLPPMTGGQLLGFITGETPPENLNELRFRKRENVAQHLGVREGIDPKKLEESGWGVIFAHDANPAVKEALSDLIELRRGQAGKYFRIYEGPDGFRRPDDSKGDFLARQGAGPGAADPEKVPYYLLIVGSPEKIPYRFQSQLDVQYAVGRIHFETLQEYANYASSVVAAENGQVKLPRQGAFFGVANPNDRATQLSSQKLVSPVFDKFQDEAPDWTLSSYLNDQADKAQLDKLLGGDQTPSFLFSASHGMAFSNGNKRQLPHQGALLCQDWKGPGSGPISQDDYFAGDDLTSDANLLGLIAFFFACYGGGTPKLDEFAAKDFKARKAIAPYAFPAQLPTRMLGHPGGGALAVIGHIERAWGYSFLWPGAGAQTAVFEDTFKRLMGGHPVGSAVEYFNERHAELSVDLADELEEIKFNKKPNPYQLAGMWTANNDARGYAIIGDPAVRLPVVKEDEAAVDRPLIKVRTVSGPTEEGEQVVSGVNTSLEEEIQISDEDVDTSHAPPPEVPPGFEGKYPDLDKILYGAWVDHIKDGYDNTDQVFQRILNAFLRSHNSTLAMYWILFLIGVVTFVGATYLDLTNQSQVPFAALGGLGIVSIITYFVGRSIQSIEENLKYITWLGIIYNSYWTKLNWTFDKEDAQENLDKANKDAIAQLEHLIDRHAVSVGKRPGLQKQGDDSGSE